MINFDQSKSLCGGEGFTVREEVAEAALRVSKEVKGVEVSLMLIFTSIKMRPNPEAKTESGKIFFLPFFRE